MVKLSLSRDFTAFLEDDTYPHIVAVNIGKRTLICSGMLIAQQSTVLDALIRKDNIITFEKMEDVGTVEQKVDCIRYLYGADLAFDLQNIKTAVKFGSLYGVDDLFNEAVKWIESNLSVRNFLKIHDIPFGLEDEKHTEQLKGVINNFMSKNTTQIAKEFTQYLNEGGVIGSSLILAVLASSPTNGAKLLKTWVGKSDENRAFILENASKLEFVKLFPSQEGFTKFVMEISAESSCVDTMKQVLALQQDYFIKSTALAAAKQANPKKSVAKAAPAKEVTAKEVPAKEPEKLTVEEEVEEITTKLDEVSVEGGNEGDDAESVASSANTASSKNKNRARSAKFKKEQPRAGPRPAKKKGGDFEPQVPTKGKGARQGRAHAESSQDFRPNSQPNMPSKESSRSDKQDLAKKVHPVIPPVDDQRKIFVGNVSENVTEAEVIRLFSAHGIVTKVNLVPQRKCAFVEFEKVETVQSLLKLSETGDFVLQQTKVYVKPFRVQGAAGNLAKENMVNPEHKIFVSNIPDAATESDIRDTFMNFGSVVNIDLLSHKKFCFIEFSEVESVVNVLQLCAKGCAFLIMNTPVSIKPFKTSASLMPHPKFNPAQAQHAPHNDPATNRKLFIAALPLNTTVQEVSGLFLLYGKIVHIDLKSDKRFAFLEFASDHSVKAVLYVGRSGAKFMIRNQVLDVKEYTTGTRKIVNQRDGHSSVV